MDTICVVGERPLYGEVRIHGGKNAVLPILAATAAIGGEFVIHNCPEILDVYTALAILRGLGATAELRSGTAVVNSRGLHSVSVPAPLAGRMRASVLFLGALLARFSHASVPLPGGCLLGQRPLDQHLHGLRTLCVKTELYEDRIEAAGTPQGGAVILRCPSVGATENLMLAALGAQEPVTLLGAAKEPEIVCLASFLRACGKQIDGAGSSCIRIGGGALHGAEFTVMPDRMEAATYLACAVCAGGRLTLTQVEPSHLRAVTELYAAAGCRLRSWQSQLEIAAEKLRAVGPVVTGPYPAFPTDAQATLMASLLRAEGTTVIEETVFERRFRHVRELQKLGAQIRVAGRLASIRGVERLHGAQMEATDLRGGAAMLAAALGAAGKSTLKCTRHIARGYENIGGVLRRLGAELHTEEEERHGSGKTEPQTERQAHAAALRRAASDV